MDKTANSTSGSASEYLNYLKTLEKAKATSNKLLNQKGYKGFRKGYLQNIIDQTNNSWDKQNGSKNRIIEKGQKELVTKTIETTKKSI